MMGAPDGFAALDPDAQAEAVENLAGEEGWCEMADFPAWVPGHLAGAMAARHYGGALATRQRRAAALAPIMPVPVMPMAHAIPPMPAVAPMIDPVAMHAPTLITWAEDFWNPPDPGDEWLIDPVIASGRAHSVYAGAKAGKSLFVLAIVAAAATGREVLHRPAGEPLRTMYLDYEMIADDLRERLADMGYGPDDDLSALAYYSLPSMPPLDTAEGGAHVLALAREHRADLVVIDTLSRVIDGPENDSDTIRAMYRHTGSRLKAAGIATLRIDHAGKDAEKGERGTSAKRDDLDVIWRLVPRDRGRYELKASPPPRMGWVPHLVKLEQTTEPLDYRLTDDAWPAGTADAVAVLDRLAVPLDYGKDRARQAIKAAGETAPRNETLMAALRLRRTRATVPDDVF